VKKAANKSYKKAWSTVGKAQRRAKKAALHTKRHIEKGTRKVASSVRKGTRKFTSSVRKGARKVASSVRKGAKNLPKIRSLSRSEKNVAKSVFGNTINYDMVKVTDTLGFGGAPWTTNSPPIYTLNVGSSAYPSLTAKYYKALLIHELTHVWQGQHLVPFMLNSAAHQTLAVINNGGKVSSRAAVYRYTPGKRWGQYNVEQQASIVEDWFRKGRKTTDARYRYIRDNIRKGRVN